MDSGPEQLSTSPPAAGGTGRLVLLSTSHRVAPGLLCWPAWSALRSAAHVYAGDAAHPLVPALGEAGVRVEPLTAEPAEPAEPAAALAANLLASARESAGTVVWLLAADGDEPLLHALGEQVAYDPAGAPEVELLPGSYDLPGARFLDLASVMDRLRSPGGCPWDREQTHASLVRFLLEEAYELAEAIETGDRAALREELGDVLMQVAFHARVAAEHPDDPWTVDDVAGDIVDKLVRRHPHVFACAEVPEGEQMQARWDELKAEEKPSRSVVEGVPLAQPALALAGKLAGRAERAGLDVPTGPAGPPAPWPGDAADAEVDAAYVGDLLLAVATGAHRRGIDAEQALRASARGYRDRILAAEHGG